MKTEFAHVRYKLLLTALPTPTPQAEFRSGTGRWALLETADAFNAMLFDEKCQTTTFFGKCFRRASHQPRRARYRQGLGVCLQRGRGQREGIAIQTPCLLLLKDRHRQPLTPSPRLDFLSLRLDWREP